MPAPDDGGAQRRRAENRATARAIPPPHAPLVVAATIASKQKPRAPEPRPTIQASPRDSSRTRIAPARESQSRMHSKAVAAHTPGLAGDSTQNLWSPRINVAAQNKALTELRRVAPVSHSPSAGRRS